MSLFESLEEENKELKRVNDYLLKIVETATRYIHSKEMALIKDQVYEKRERDLR